jgi:hypothetical protein
MFNFLFLTGTVHLAAALFIDILLIIHLKRDSVDAITIMSPEISWAIPGTFWTIGKDMP